MQELVQRSRTMTEDEILVLPEKPDVIKGLLAINGLTQRDKAARMAEQLANKMESITNNQASGLEEMPCQIYRISSETFWLHIGGTQLEAKEGWHWAVIPGNKIWMHGTIFDNDLVIGQLAPRSTFVQNGQVKNDLYRLEVERRNRL